MKDWTKTIRNGFPTARQVHDALVELSRRRLGMAPRLETAAESTDDAELVMPDRANLNTRDNKPNLKKEVRKMRQLLGTIGLVALAILTLTGVECLVFLATRCEAIIRF